MSKEGHPSERSKQSAKPKTAGRPDIRAGDNKAEYKGFLTHTPSKAEAAQCAAWLDDTQDVTDATNLLVASGFKLSVTYSEKAESYVASIYRTAAGYPDSGYGISAFAGGYLTAVGRVVFLVSVLGQGDLSGFMSALPRRYDDPWGTA